MIEKKTGIFFDGKHTLLGFQKLLNDKMGDLSFRAAESTLHDFLKVKMETSYRFIYQGWFEGIHKGYLPSQDSNKQPYPPDATHLSRLDGLTDAQLHTIILRYHNDRMLHLALIEAGIEPIWLKRKATKGGTKERGVDTALAVALLRRVEMFNLEAVVVFTNDKDHEPLFHNVRKSGIAVITIDCSPGRGSTHSTPRFVEKSFYYGDIFDAEKLLSMSNESD